MIDQPTRIADDVRRNAELSPVQLLAAGHWLIRKTRRLEIYCSGAVNGDACPAYARGGVIAEATCPGLGVRYDGLPAASDVRNCRIAAQPDWRRK